LKFKISEKTKVECDKIKGHFMD